MTIRIAHLYPRHLNLYGDRGNIMCLEARCRWRGLDVSVTEMLPGEPIDPSAFDLIFLGGGPDREQERIADDLREVKGEGLRRAAESGVVVLAVCGGYQLLGHYYRPAEGPDLAGLGLLDLHTIHPGPKARRCIGNIAVSWGEATLVGFENHGGRTYLGSECPPLGKVTAGFGNNGQDGTEGAQQGTVFGTYLHGSLLPKNPQFTDHLLGLALEHRGEDATLPPLDDRAERQAHDAAVQLSRREKRA